MLRTSGKKETILGISVHENAVRVLLLSVDKNNTHALRFNKEVSLPPHTFENGLIKNSSEFVKALKALTSGSLARTHKQCVVTIPDTYVYHTTLEIPRNLSEKKREELIRSHLEVHSPIDVSGSYFDSEEYQGKDETKKEVTIAIGEKRFVDPFIDALHKADITPVAVETHMQSIKRVLRAKAGALHLLALLTPRDVENIILKNGQIIFRHTQTLTSEAQSSKDAHDSFIANEVLRVFEFYVSEHPAEKIEDFTLVGDGVSNELVETLTKQLGIPYGKPLPNMPVSPELANAVEKNPISLVTLGIAARGLIARSKDKLISLAPEGTEELWRQARLLAFARVVSDFIIIVSFVLVLVFGGSWAFFNFFFQHNIEQNLQRAQTPELNEKIKQLETQIADFNTKVTLLNTLYQRVPDWTIAIGDIQARIRPGLQLENVTYDLNAGAVSLNGTATTIGNLIDFKNILSFSGLYDGELRILFSQFEAERNVDFNHSLKLKDKNVLFPYTFLNPPSPLPTSTPPGTTP